MMKIDWWTVTITVAGGKKVWRNVVTNIEALEEINFEKEKKDDLIREYKVL